MNRDSYLARIESAFRSMTDVDRRMLAVFAEACATDRPRKSPVFSLISGDAERLDDRAPNLAEL